MAGPTDILTEDVKELREAHRRLAEEAHELRGDLADFRTDMAEKLGTINGTLERLEGRIGHSISVAKWTVGILIPIVISLIGTAFWLTWHAAELDSRVERLEQEPRIEQRHARR